MSVSQTSPLGWPKPQGLWHPSHEKDSCGVGFIAHLKGKRSHDIVQKTLTMNANMDHRGASGSDPDTGDGAGLLVQMPDKFLRKEMAKKGIELPPEGDYGSGVVFLSPDPSEREAAMRAAAEAKQKADEEARQAKIRSFKRRKNAKDEEKKEFLQRVASKRAVRGNLADPFSRTPFLDALKEKKGEAEEEEAIW